MRWHGAYVSRHVWKLSSAPYCLVRETAGSGLRATIAATRTPIIIRTNCIFDSFCTATYNTLPLLGLTIYRAMKQLNGLKTGKIAMTHVVLCLYVVRSFHGKWPKVPFWLVPRPQLFYLPFFCGHLWFFLSIPMTPTPCNKVNPSYILQFLYFWCYMAQNGLNMHVANLHVHVHCVHVHVPVGLADIGNFVPCVNKKVGILGHKWRAITQK